MSDSHESLESPGSKPSYKAWFQSIEDETERYALDEIVYKSSTGVLLEVQHDIDELRKTSAEEW